MDQNQEKGLNQYAMEYGLYFGLILIIKFVLTSFSQTSSILNMLSMALVVAVPIVVYFLVKSYRDKTGTVIFGKLWFFGIALYFYSALISGIFEYLYYQYINPEYLYTMQESISTLAKELLSANNTQSLEDLDALIGENGIMSSIQIVYNGILGMLMLGSIYSLILALLLRRSQEK